MNNYPKGSEWRKWDLHFHTPSSYDYKDKSIADKDIIQTLIKNKIAVVAVTDHHVIDVKRIKNLQNISKGKITILPGIEFCGDARGREPIHFIGIFPEDSDVSYIWDKLKVESKIFEQKNDGKKNNEIYVDLSDTTKLIKDLGGIVTIHAGKKSNSIECITNSLPVNEAIKEDLIKHVDVFELGKGEDQTAYIEKVFPNIKRGKLPMIICSDNHNIRDYKLKEICWIKADPTFEGLKQIIYEPERVYIGEKPELLKRVEENRTKFIQNIRINQTQVYDEKFGVWFKDIDVHLNSGLVAIIGNKGSGKSALLDIIGLCGNSHIYKEFSFLKDGRFKKDGLAKNFEAKLEWEDRKVVKKNLNDRTDLNAPERVKYLPQGYFERLTSNIESSEFKKTLENVIFSHLPEEEKLGKSSFKELIDYKKDNIENDERQIINNIENLNKEIIQLEKKEHPEYIDKIKNQLVLKEAELEEYKKMKPRRVKNPETSNGSSGRENARLEKLGKRKKQINNERKEIKEKNKFLLQEKEDLGKIKQELISFSKQIDEYKTQNKDRFRKHSLNTNEIIKLNIDMDVVEKAIRDKEKERIKNTEKNKKLYEEYQKADAEIKKIGKKLSEQGRNYQKYLEENEEWKKKIDEITGNKDKEGSIKYLKNEINYINKQLRNDLENKRNIRLQESIKIFKKKIEIVNIYGAIKNSVEQEIRAYQSMLKDYQINIEATLRFSNGFIEKFLNYINQRSKGTFYGIDEGKEMLKNLITQIKLPEEGSLKAFLKEIISKLEYDSREPTKGKRRYIIDQIPEERLKEFYNYVFSIEYIEPVYKLKLAGKDLKLLSPGERGALLIVFYLMLEKDNVPLLIDQPEENLDNESIYEVLTNFIKLTKKERQIIIVTHNPNLAIVGDAEQIIFVNIDKENKNTFSFESGSIENPSINKHASDILEGTLKAFDTRRLKYLRKKL